jgi:hypothetical protein
MFVLRRSKFVEIDSKLGHHYAVVTKNNKELSNSPYVRFRDTVMLHWNTENI